MLLILLATYTAFVVETSIVPLLGWGPFAPRVVLAALVWLVWRSNGRLGLWTAAAWGLISDGLASGPLGIDVVVFVLGAAGVQVIRDRVPRAPWAVGLTAGLIALAVPIVATALRLAVEQHTVEVRRLVLAASPAACSSALLTILCLVFGRSLLGRRSMSDDESPTRVSNRWNMLTE